MRIACWILLLLAATPYPASAITITFDNMNGATTFSTQGSNWSGGTVRTEGNPSLYASGAFSYEVNAGGAMVTFDQPVTNVRFFYVHGSGHGAGVATSFDAAGAMLDTRNSISNGASGSKFVDFPASPAISRITFSDGVIDSFSYDPVPNNQPPVAVIGPNINCTGLTCDFDGSGSSDSDGTITDFSWDFGDGTATVHGSNLAMVTHAYTMNGSFALTLTVTDDQNDTGMATLNVTVSAAAPFVIDTAVEGSWFEQGGVSSGQGFFMDYFISIDQLFIAWFTFDINAPMPMDTPVGASDQRWLTALLSISGDTASGDLNSTSGGLFDTPTPMGQSDKLVGNISIQFTDCANAMVTYTVTGDPNDPNDDVSRTFAIEQLGQAVVPGFSCP